MASQDTPDTPLIADDQVRLLQFIESAAASPMAIEDSDFADESLLLGSSVAESAQPASQGCCPGSGLALRGCASEHTV